MQDPSLSVAVVSRVLFVVAVASCNTDAAPVCETPCPEGGEVCTPSGCVVPDNGGDGTDLGGANDPNPPSGGGLVCTTPGVGHVVRGVPWLSQITGSFVGDSVRCGPTSLAMLDGYLSDPTAASQSTVEAIYAFLDLPGTPKDNQKTTIDQLDRATRVLLGYDSSVVTGWTSSDLEGALSAGHVVIVPFHNQYWICTSALDCAACPGVWEKCAGGACKPTCRNANPYQSICTDAACSSPATPPVCKSGTSCSSEIRPGGLDHFVVLVGIDDRFVYVNDPARSDAYRDEAQYRPYDRTSFCNLWDGVGLVVKRCQVPSSRACTTDTGAPSSQTCDADGRYGACSSTQICVPNEMSCSNGVLTTCNANGTATTSSPCPTTGTCASSTECAAPVCTPNVTTCSGGTLTTCNGTGTGNSQSTCASGQCNGNACAPSETCNGIDDDGDGVVDNPPGCWRTIYRFRTNAGYPIEARCYDTTNAASSACPGYVYEREAFVVHANSIPGTFELRQCSKQTDHILIDGGASDRTALQNAGYDCSTVLGYAYSLGLAPAASKTPFSYACPLYRFSYSTDSTGAHIFTTGADLTNGMTCEPPARATVQSNTTCFGSTPAGC